MVFSPKNIILWFSLFIFNWGSGQVFSWKNPNLKKDSTLIDSLVAEKINKDFFTKDTLDFIKKQNKLYIDEAVLVKKNPAQMLSDLNAKGAIIRGVNFGNTQGSSVQSSMDLQIAGKVSKDVSVTASISDHNLPIQADGYTQTLDEFDKIFIRLNIKKNTIIKAGNIEPENHTGYFSKYQRRSMGLALDTKLGTENSTRLNLSAGVSRSEFHRIRFQGIEGSQGPYRLTGKNGETFITVISGSEQVFLDGVLMKRGKSQDYTINYNTGEITFTSFRPIYQQNFITVSYNYTNRNYTRYLFTGGVQRDFDKLKLGVSWFSESDNKFAPLSLDLSERDEEILAKAGSNPALMYAPSAAETNYDPNKILYRKVSHPNGDYYEFSTDSSLTLYQVAFTYFGENKGDYKIKQTTNNGQVFEYVGANNGDYSPLRKLPAPQKSQMISAHSVYEMDRGRVVTDFSLSNFDANTFSTLDNHQNIGYAGHILAEKTFSKNNWTATPKVEFRHISSRYHILDRINDVEFARNFNLSQEFNQRTQNQLVLGIDNHWAKQGNLSYQFNLLNERSSYRGVKNDFQFDWNTRRTSTTAYFSHLGTRSPLQHTRVKGGTEYRLLGAKGFWAAGGSMEYNAKHLDNLNTLETDSYSWKELFVQKKIGDSTRTKLLAKLYYRTNDSVQSRQLKKVNDILGLMAESQIIKTEKSTLNAQVHYRRFFIKDSLIKQRTEDFILGNILYSQQLFRNGMRLQAFYELGNGREILRDFQYIKVPAGQGFYKWTDYSGDGIQQIDEFEIAEYSDLAQYIRVYTNAIKYVPSNKNKLQLALFVNPAVIFNSENDFLKRWNFNLSIFSQNSYYKGKRTLVLSPFERNASQILKNQNILGSIQFSNNEKSGWNGSYQFINNNNIINANQSNEVQKMTSNTLTIGYWFSRQFRIDWENRYQNSAHFSEVFKTRDYKIRQAETKPKLIYSPTDAIQVEFSSSYKVKNRLEASDFLKAYNITGSLQWSFSRTVIRGMFSFINNDFSGNSNSIVGNVMLDGLKPGKNKVWTLYFQQPLTRLIQMNLNYEGRNSGDRTIHIGSVQVSANF